MKCLIDNSKLIKAVREHKYFMVRLYILLGVSVNQPDKAGMTPLMHAIAIADAKMARLLLQNRASLTVVDNDGWTAAMWAQFRGDKECISVLRGFCKPLPYHITDENPHVLLGVLDTAIKIKV